MRLSLAQVRQFAAGCERVEAEGDAVRFQRLPDSLARHYRNTEARQVRLECPSAVRLRFHSDTPWVGLRLRYGGAARPFYQGVVTVDGEADAVFGPARAVEHWEGRVAVPGAGRRAVEIWFPTQVVTLLESVTVKDGSLLAAAPALARRWLVLGDSITQGMTAPLPTESYVVRTARALGLDVRSFGIGGGTISAELAAQPIDWPYDVLTVAYGTNDFNGSIPPATFAANAEQLLRQHAGAHPQARLILITPISWVGRTAPNALGAHLQAYRDVLGPVAATVPGVHLVEGPALVPPDTSLFVDNVHPNAAGMAVYAENLTAVLENRPCR